jgi:purine-binding chemotaxis protein CheW
MDAAREALERKLAPSSEEQKSVLHERARALARAPEKPRAEGSSVEVMEFVLAYETYGIESSYIHEVWPLKELTPLPGTPPFVLGIINIRGRILSVIDLKKFFDLPEKGLTELNKVVVLRSPQMEFGVLADAILGVRRIPVGELQPSLPTLTGVREEYLKGVTADRVVILDAAKLLSDRRMIVQEQAEA